AGDARCRMLIDTSLPEKRAGGCIDGIDRRVDVAEIREGAAGGISDTDGASHHRVRIERPVRTTTSEAQGKHTARRAADEDATANHGRLARGHEVAGESKCPLQLKVRYLRRRQSSVRGRLIAVVRPAR